MGLSIQSIADNDFAGVHVFVIWNLRVSKAEGADFGGVLVIVDHVVSDDWLRLVLDTGPVDTVEERMRF